MSSTSESGSQSPQKRSLGEENPDDDAIAWSGSKKPRIADSVPASPVKPTLESGVVGSFSPLRSSSPHENATFDDIELSLPAEPAVAVAAASDRGTMDVDEPATNAPPSSAASPHQSELHLPGPSSPPASSPAIGYTESSSATKEIVEATQKSKPKSAPKKTQNVDGKKPTSGAKQAKKAKPKGKTKVDDLKSSGVKARSASVSESIPPTDSVASSETLMYEDEIDPEDTAVYCICQKPYAEEDDEVLMIACDACNNWFHPACVGLAEDKVDQLDVYICASCEKSTTQRTTYKMLCRAERCEKSVAGSSSNEFRGRQLGILGQELILWLRYCSSSCAFRHMADQIPPMANKKVIKQLQTAFIGLPRPRTGVATITHLAPVATSTSHLNQSGREREARVTATIRSLEDQMAAVESALATVVKRQRLLELVIAQTETLPPVAATHTHESGKKGKGGGRSTDDRPCGWNAKLIWEDDQVLAWSDTLSGSGGEEGVNADDRMVGVEEHPGVCMSLRRRCDRHQGWQKTMAVGLEVEMVQLSKRRDTLETQVEMLQSNLESEAASKTVRDGFIQRLDAAALSVAAR